MPQTWFRWCTANVVSLRADWKYAWACWGKAIAAESIERQIEPSLGRVLPYKNHPFDPHEFWQKASPASFTSIFSRDAYGILSSYLITIFCARFGVMRFALACRRTNGDPIEPVPLLPLYGKSIYTGELNLHAKALNEPTVGWDLPVCRGGAAWIICRIPLIISFTST